MESFLASYGSLIVLGGLALGMVFMMSRGHAGGGCCGGGGRPAEPTEKERQEDTPVKPRGKADGEAESSPAGRPVDRARAGSCH